MGAFMNITAVHKTMTALPLIAMLALAGCGGGGGGGTAGSPQTPGGGDGGSGGGTSPEPLMPAMGLKIGEADATTGAVTLSSTAVRDYDAKSVSLIDGTYIKSISDDGSGGYSVTYIVDGQESTIAFASSDFQNGSYVKDVGGAQFWFWTSGSGGDDFRTFGSSIPGQSIRYQTYVATGNETGASALPGGTAQYVGSIWGDMYDNNDPNPARSSRARTRGSFTLTADFADGSLGGRIFNLAIQENGAASSSDPFNAVPNSSSIRIHDGKIVDGQFTAELTGEDDDSSVAFEDSARGFDGDMVGAFYGPAAEEVGGVFNAKRDSGGLDQVLVGRFGGEKFGPSVDLAADALVAGIDRYVGDRSELLTDDGMARIERTANGWSVTVDGQSVTLDDDDYGALARLSNIYYKVLGNDESASFFTATGGFGPNPTFDHFDVKGWAYVTWAPGTNIATADFVQDGINANYVYVLHGNRTPAGDIPVSGMATYTGSMGARDFPTDDGVSSLGPDATLYRGKATLTALFGSSSVGGRLFDLESRPGDGSSFAGVQGELTFAATISGNGFTASDVTGTGDVIGYQSGSVRGAFFGPAVEEAGGVFDATDATNNRAMVGYFGGDKQ